MGIDPSTVRMSVATIVPVELRGPAFVVETLSLPRVENVARNEHVRLAATFAELESWLAGLVRVWSPEVVVVETPFAHGRLVPTESFHVIGVLLAVLGGLRVRVERMGPQEWKRAALGAGAGGTKKPAAKCPRGGSHTWPRANVYGDGSCLKCGAAGYGVLRWARTAGYEGVLWDEADALGLATAGGVRVDQRDRA